MNEIPLVSIVVPTRNEEKFISNALDSILNNTYPKDRMEVLIIDGMSDDKTREIVRRYLEGHKLIRIIDNPKKIVPTALNIGIQNAKGEIIMRMDAHCTYNPDYISNCVDCLRDYDADNVGGIWITLPGGKTSIARSIALALSSPFGVGNAYYRIGSNRARYVDTVPFGCYRREVFQKIGLFDEDMVRNQDDEFNFRLIRRGGKILLAPSIISYYYARDKLSKLGKMIYQYGYFKPLVAKKIGAVVTLRQLIPTIFVCSLFISGVLSLIIKKFLWLFLFLLIVYLASNLSFSFFIALRNKKRYLPLLPLVFVILHFGYGLGYLKGIVDFIVLRKHNKKSHGNIQVTR